MKGNKIKSVAAKALIAAHPLYHTWSREEQVHFRAKLDQAAQNRVDAILLKEIHNIQCTAENAGKIWRDLPLSKLDNLNWAKLLTTGVGDDMLMLNESMAENTSLLDFATLYDYDFDDHLFQESVNKKELKDYQARDYYPLRFSRWARLIIEDQFYYATLLSLAGHLTDHIKENGDNIIETLIPHKYIPGKNHGKSSASGYQWDMKIDAEGQEAQLDELTSRWYEYTNQRWLDLSQEFAAADPAVFMEDLSYNNENHRNFIFNNETALKGVRWRKFLSDCQAIRSDFTYIDDLRVREMGKAETWLRETCEDILKSFDPNILPFRKKRKIIIAPGAFDGLLGGDDELE